MINWNETTSLFFALSEQEKQVNKIRFIISVTRSPIAVDILTDELKRAIKARDQTRKILDQYYIHGITSDQILKDIQPY